MKRLNNIPVKNGKVRIQCSNCKKNHYYSVAPGTRKKIVRCRKCSKTTYCIFNHRQQHREACAVRAEVIIHTTRKIQTHLCNVSLTGIGFIVNSGTLRSFHIGQQIVVQYKATYGKNCTRKARVANVSPDRIGAQYIDISIS